MEALKQFFTILFDVLFSRQISPVKEPIGKPTTPVAPDPDEAIPEPETLNEEYGTAAPIIRAMKRLGHEVFESDEKDLNLNIVAVRDPDAKVDQFSCRIHVFWKFQGKWKHLDWEITTYPGSRYLVEKLLNPRGAAILVPGQYKGIYKMDLHGGRYRALCQRHGNVRVYRDGDRDREFDLDPSTIMTGSFGINVHAPVTLRAGVMNYIANRVYAASAGCQVFRSVADFLEFRALCDRAVKIWGNRFTLTLITEDDLESLARVVLPHSKEKFDHGEEFDPDIDTLGVRHKNPLNVKQDPSNPWLYSTGHDNRMHAIFPTHAKGLRAGIRNLRTYWVKHRKRTIADILARWAPASDTVGSLPGGPRNSPQKYSLYVSRSMDGFSPFAPLDLFDDKGRVKNADQLYALVNAMAQYENKPSLQIPRSVFNEAVELL